MKDKILGKVEELRGRMSGDRGMETKGKARQMMGEAKRVGKEVVYDAEHPQRPTSPPPER
ncbi:MAG TPA: CsbD family protein [Candidatus Dormibacteraeota bacterium]|nr:CsbD family protein [Candidatus Dormibacteraeota bacterium]